MLQVFLWTALYGIVFTVFRALSEWAVAIAMSAFVFILVVWLFRTGKNKVIFMQKTQQIDTADIIKLLPLLSLPICNTVISDGWSIGFYIPLGLVAAVCEEILFRGVLLRWLLKYGRLYAVITSSLLFALLHIVNIAQTEQLSVTALQMLVAFSAGILYSVIVLKYRSLIPGILSHCLVNITAGGSAYDLKPDSTAILLVFSSVHIIYAIIFYSINRRVNKEG